MDCLNVYVLTTLCINCKGNVQSRNIGVTFSLHQAERHKGQGVEHDFESFLIGTNWREDAATTDLVHAMREFCDMVREWQAAALIEG
jgi:hypothetical protein